MCNKTIAGLKVIVQIGALALLIIFFSFILLVLSCTMVGYSAYSLIHMDDNSIYHEVSGEFVKDIKPEASILCVIGVFLGLVSLVSLCGFLPNNRPLMIAYTKFMAVILTLEVVAGIVGLVLRNNSKWHLTKIFNVDLQKYNGNSPDVWHNNELNQIQLRFKCCGLTNYKDWSRAIVWKRQYKGKNLSETVPSTCCNTGTKETWDCPVMNNGKLNKRLNKNGCVDTLKSTIPLLGIFSISIFAIQLIIA